MCMPVEITGERSGLLKNGKKKKPNDYGTGIPQHEMEALARVLLPEIDANLLSGRPSRPGDKRPSDGLRAVIYIKNENTRRSAKELPWFLSYTEIRQK